ncbi:glycosyltransferase [uncultured Fusobacterium sp.]|jgi:glycosyltransferase involved in cell wall biosynthesis|uniref:glycosyltransferase n=1 Tax=uncultured Fusobacterium sp. TaxID=159267 RepID=UPI00258F058A|nr:glycosyltransferase [uncultured Fusobacterium sp.]
MDKKNYKILFIGGVFPREIEKKIIKNSRGSVQIAANNVQWRIIDGLDQNLIKPITIINSMFVGSYPKHYNEVLIKEEKFSHCEGANDINLGFFNLAYIKHFLNPFHQNKYIKNWLNENKHDEKFVFIYSLSKQAVKIAEKIKKISPNTPVIVYCGDLPEHMMQEHKHQKLVNIYKKYSQEYINKRINYIDGFIIVAEEQAKRMDLSKEKYMIMEGLIDPVGKQFVKLNSNTRIRNIVYAGGLSKKYGIKELIQSFKQIKREDIRLIFCGGGIMKDYILEASKSDKRIIYKGVLPHSELQNIFNEAYITINPTPKGQSFTNFSFPIKNLDYLFSGRPVVCERLEAIPKEYDDYFIYYNSEHELKNALEDILNKPIKDINEIGFKNFDFVIKTKCIKVQAMRIIQFAETFFTN